MSLSKKALMIGIGSTLAVGGVTTAIAVPLSQSQSETKQFESKPWTSLNAAKNVDESLNKLTNSSIAFKNKEGTAEIKREDNYAFNIEASQLSLKEEEKKTFPSSIKLEFKIDTANNKVVDLNKGILSVELEAKNEDNVVGKTTFKIEGFKAVSEQNNKLVTTTNDKVTLDLSKVDATAYRTIETLNKLSPVAVPENLRSAEGEETTTPKMESGLSTLLHKLMLGGEVEQKPDPKQWDINSSVKLDRVSMKDEKANFHLVNALNNQYLKLVNTTQNSTEELLVDEVVVTNLLASNISLSPVGLNPEENEVFVKEFAEKAEANGYKKVGEKIGLEIKETIVPNNLASTVSVKPTILEKKAKGQEVSANLLVSFGSGETTKTYNLADEKNRNELKEAGFSFGVYLKVTTSKDKLLKAETITTGSKLDELFKQDNFTMPFMISDDAKMGFTKVNITDIDQIANFKLGMADKVENTPKDLQRSDIPEEVPVLENWVTFVSYTYKGISGTNRLVTPVLDVIHLEVKQPTIPPSISPAGQAGSQG